MTDIAVMAEENAKRQQIAITDHKGDMLVSASAGSGKTYTMIQRIIDIILKKEASVNEILAVTFTKTAASEIKERLKSALSSGVAQGNKELVPELKKVATASISTIDSFFSDLVRTYFFEADADPEFSIIDENDATVLKQKTIDDLFDEKYEKKDENFFRLLSVFSRSRQDEHFKTQIIKTVEKASVEEKGIGILRDNLSNFTEEYFKGMLAYFKNRLDNSLNGIIEEIKSITEEAKKLKADKLVSASALCAEVFEGYVKCKDVYSLKGFKIDSKANKPNIKDADFAVAELLERYAETKGRGKKALDDAIVGLNDYETDLSAFLSTKEDTENLVRLIEEYERAYAEKKKELAKLDFADLASKAYKILQNESIRKTVSEKYKYIFIDEYQDVNGIQEAIFKKIGRNNLFMVGDLKQSIYGFRGCNSGFFADKAKEYMTADDAKLLELVVNHRSAPNILDYCNTVFTGIMTDRTDMPYSPLVTYGGYGKYRGECRLYNVVDDDAGRIIDDVYGVKKDYEEGFGEEVSAVGVLVKQIIEKSVNGYYYAPPKDRHEPLPESADDPENLKKIEYGDIAILVGEFNEEVDAILEVLKRSGIPVSTQGETKLDDYPEIKQLLNLLSLIDNYSSDVPLASTLKLIAGLDEEDLFAIRKFTPGRDKSFYEAYLRYMKSNDDELCKKLKKFDCYYKRLRDRSGILSVYDILQSVIREKDLDLKWGAMKLGALRLERVNAFLSIANNLGDYDVYTFLKKVKTGKCLNVNETGGENAVIVTTVHKSKGLEYPIVILANAQHKFNTGDFTNEDFFYNRNFGLAIKTYDRENRKVGTNLYRRYFAENAGDFLRYEKIRLLYVALTRAKYSMYIVANGKETPKTKRREVENANNFFELFDYTPAYEYNKIYSSTLENAVTSASEREIYLNDGNDTLVENIRKSLSFNYLFGADITLPEKSSVTAIAKEYDESESYVPALYKYADDDATERIERGVAYHKYLELYDFDGGFLTADMPEEHDGIVDEEKIKRILSLEVLKNLKGYKTYKEKKFTVNLPAGELKEGYVGNENMVVQGTIDLLAIKDGRAVIVDYKFSVKEDEELVKRYAKQLELYKRAVEISLDAKVEKTVIVNLQKERQIIL